MIDKKYNKGNIPLTLEQFFSHLAELYPEVRDMYSLWQLLRKDLEDRLPHSRSTFVHYSLHDATHSRSVIRAIERFLGEERILQLSATDTFMLLCCAYAHDYGMAITFNQIYDTLGDAGFKTFVKTKLENAYSLDKKNLQAFQNLFSYIKDQNSPASLQELYFAIMLVIQEYLRPTHWNGAKNIWNDFKGLLEGRLNGRFIQGCEGIIDICECHGKSFQDVLKLSDRADGIIGDDFHPRFIAAMLRLGDLLDLDNGRFPRWFIDEISRNRELIPHLSELHYKKHEAITHLLITPKRIEICASCHGKNGYEVAGLVNEWIDWLEDECTNQIQYWSEITPINFGRPPRVAKYKISLNGKPYTAESCTLQMRMSQDRVMKLLEGTSIYQDQYVCIRELVQNAVDTSLLQLWDDITHNRYINLGISKRGHKARPEENMDSNKEMGMLEHGSKVWQEVFGNYPITVELIEDWVDQKVYIVIKDNGTGITPQDVRYMSDIGTSKEKNERIVEIMRTMPRWLKPSGIFGIGLQSAFQLTDQIEFYTRRPNEPERLIIFHSYGRNHGKIEIREVSPNDNGIYYDNSIPGTNVKIAINPDKLLSTPKAASQKPEDNFFFYDMEFDGGENLHAIYVELSKIIEQKLRENPCDYFNIYFQPMVRREADTPPEKGFKQRPRYSYFAPHKSDGKLDLTQKQIDENTILPFFIENADSSDHYYFSRSMAYYADEEKCRIYHLKVRTGCIIETAQGKRLQLPEPVRNLYHFRYKFNQLSNADSIYPRPVRHLRNVHAGFLSWNINILDENAENYLNIDRDRLREGAVSEVELTYVQKKILNRWCDYLIKRFEQVEGRRMQREEKARAKHEHANTENLFKLGETANIYKNDPCTLIPLVLLFYQNVPIEKFREFMKPYSDFLQKQNYILAGEDFCVDELWKENTVFQSCFLFPLVWPEQIADNAQAEDSTCKIMHADTISCLPHRLIRIKEIRLNSQKELSYYFKLGPHPETPNGIQMDDAARLNDYCGAMDPDPSHRSKINFDSLVRKVFKPDQLFPHLLVSKYPKTFKRGTNFSLSLDHCIRWYILSPFDRELTKYLNEFIIDKNQLFSEAKIKEEIIKYTEKSQHIKKCFKYVYEQQIARTQIIEKSFAENLKSKIRSEYIDFLYKCCMILIHHKDIIEESFKKEPIDLFTEESF